MCQGHFLGFSSSQKGPINISGSQLLERYGQCKAAGGIA